MVLALGVLAVVNADAQVAPDDALTPAATTPKPIRPEPVESTGAVDAAEPAGNDERSDGADGVPTVDAASLAAPTGGTKAAILTVHDAITDVMRDSLERRVNEAREQGATVIVFELNTPGGLVTSALSIGDLIKNLPDIKTVAWVNTEAHSGGAMLAVACDEIVMARSSRIGDSQVILIGPGGAGSGPGGTGAQGVHTRAGGVSRIRAVERLRPSAQRGVCSSRPRGLVDRAHRNGERKFVFREEKLKLLGEKEIPSERKSKDGDEDEKAPPEVVKDDSVTPEWKLAETYYDPLLDMETEVLQPVVRDDQLLEMSAGEAYAYGFNKALVTTESELRERYDIGEVIRLNPTWSEALAYWLTSTYVRGFLLVIILLGAYVEFHTPGVGVPGLVALIVLGIFVGAPYVAGFANIWEILLIAIGIALILLEIFVIPGFGIAGISGLVLVLLGLVATFVPEEPGRSFPIYLPSLPSSIEWAKMAIATIVSSMAASLVGMFVLSKFLPRLPMFRLLVPANPTPSEVAIKDPYRGAARVGDLGVSQGPLRPAGKAHFGSMLVDVVTRGEYLGPGTEIEVVERRGNRVVVRAVRQDGTGEA